MIKLTPAKSILGIEYGDQIKLSEVQFRRLANASFAALVPRFAESKVAAAVV